LLYSVQSCYLRRKENTFGHQYSFLSDGAVNSPHGRHLAKQTVILPNRFALFQEIYYAMKPYPSVVLVLLISVLALTIGQVTYSAAVDSTSSQRNPATGLEFLPHLATEATSLRLQQPFAPEAIIPWSKIVFQSFRDSNWEIYSSNDDSSALIRLTTHGAADVYPRLNRGATRIVFASNRTGSYEIYTMNPDGSGLVQLTFTGVHNISPEWSPDGSKIAFTSYRDGQAEIYLMQANGANQTRLTTGGLFNGMPAWSPDGSKIAFSSARTGGYRIWVMNADGSNQMQLSQQPSSLRPVWSPDSHHIAFDADNNQNGWQEGWMMNADGSGAREIFPTGGNSTYGTDAWANSWSPDGRHVAFTVISLIFHQNNWYWIDGWLRTVQTDTISGGNTFTLSPVGLECNVHWQTTDATAPIVDMKSLPPYSRADGFQVSWVGSDAGSSGMAGYDVQYRVGAAGSWTDWLQLTMNNSAVFTGSAGDTLYFRNRARDHAFNVSNWSSTTQAATTLYSWQFSGQVTDNRGSPLANVPLTILPTPIHHVLTNGNGAYQAWLKANGPHTVSTVHSSYQSVPATNLAMNEGSHLNLYLKPQDNVIVNGDFEASSAQVSNWTISGTLPITLATQARYTGNQGIAIGLECPYPCLSAPEQFLWADYSWPNMATDSQGNLHLLWTGALTAQSDATYYSLRRPDGAWVPPLLLDDAFRPQAAVDKQDVLHVIYVKSGDGIYYRRRLPTGSWSSPVRVAPHYGPAGVSPSVLTVIADEIGGVHALVVTTTGLAYLEKRPDGTWRPLHQLNQTSYWGGVMAMDRNHTLHFLWAEYAAPIIYDNTVRHQQRLANGTWGEQETISSLGSQWPHQLVITPSGEFHLLLVGPGARTHSMRAVEGAPWSAPTALPMSHGTAEMVLDSQGVLHVLNLDRSTANEGVYYRTWSSATGWLWPVRVDNFSNFPLCTYYKPAIAVDQSDQPHLFCAAEYWRRGLAEITEEVHFQQSVTIPEAMHRPTLALMYQAFGLINGGESGLELRLTKADTTATFILTAHNTDWSHTWLDVEAWAGETITISLVARQAAGEPLLRVNLDDISLGSAYPNLWLSSVNAAAMPGQEVVYKIFFGNSGGVIATDVEISHTLPTEMTFASASLPPTQTTPSLIWQLGDLLAHSEMMSLVITATVSATAVPFSSLTAPLHISSASPEMELENNSGQFILFVGQRAYLPIINR
jgi:uncharacterized repeat protein (TIGR01451 family)